MAHYDYWSDKLKRSVLLDGGADMISYGMGEKSIVAIADALNAGIPISQITWIEGTAFRSHDLEGVMDGYVSLPSFEMHARRKAEICRKLPFAVSQP